MLSPGRTPEGVSRSLSSHSFHPSSLSGRVTKSVSTVLRIPEHACSCLDPRLLPRSQTTAGRFQRCGACIPRLVSAFRRHNRAALRERTDKAVFPSLTIPCAFVRFLIDRFYIMTSAQRSDPPARFLRHSPLCWLLQVPGVRVP